MTPGYHLRNAWCFPLLFERFSLPPRKPELVIIKSIDESMGAPDPKSRN